MKVICEVCGYETKVIDVKLLYDVYCKNCGYKVLNGDKNVKRC